MKVSTLSRLHEKIELQESMTKNDSFKRRYILKVKRIKKLIVKSFEELEKESREAAEKSLDDLYTVMSELDDTDWFAIFINTMTIQFDPHTNYFAPKDKKRFDHNYGWET